MSGTLEQDVIQFLGEFHRNPLSKINLHSSIARDLGIDGDDAIAMLAAAAERYNIKTDDFPVADYFCLETDFMNPLKSIVEHFKGKNTTKQELTVQQFVALIRSRQTT